MKLPDFVIIGSPRSGTTTLFEYFRLHPDIFMTTPKEPGYFAFDDYYELGVSAYAALFDDAPDGQVRGEASVWYTTHPFIERSAERLRRLLPDIKLIYITRHPVERLYSQYVWELMTHLRHMPEVAGLSQLPLDADGFFQEYPGQRMPWRMAPTFARSFEANREFFIRTSSYIDNIDLYLSHFPSQSLLVLLLDDLASDPTGTLERVYAFLGVSADRPGGEPLVANRSSDFQSAPTRRARLQVQTARRLGLSPEAFRRLVAAVPSPAKRILRRALAATPLGRRSSESTTALVDPLDAAMRQRLIEELRRPNQRLADFLGRDLSHWNL